MNKLSVIMAAFGALLFFVAPHGRLIGAVLRLLVPFLLIFAAVREMRVRAKKREEEQERISNALLKNLRERQ